MTTSFDPYAQWLGIPKEKHPLSFYVLLGVSQFEPRADVIQRAAALRLSTLKPHFGSAHDEIARKLVGQIEAARACLLNSESKARYDMQLHKIAPHAPVPASALAPPVSVKNDLQLLEMMAAEETAAVSVPTKPKKTSSVSWESGIQRGIGTLAFGGVMILAMLIGLLSGRNAALLAAELPVWHASAEETKQVAASDQGRRILREHKEDTISRVSVKYMSMFATGCLASIIIGGYYLMRY